MSSANRSTKKQAKDDRKQNKMHPHQNSEIGLDVALLQIAQESSLARPLSFIKSIYNWAIALENKRFEEYERQREYDRLYDTRSATQRQLDEPMTERKAPPVPVPRRVQMKKAQANSKSKQGNRGLFNFNFCRKKPAVQTPAHEHSEMVHDPAPVGVDEHKPRDATRSRGRSRARREKGLSNPKKPLTHYKAVKPKYVEATHLLSAAFEEKIPEVVTPIESTSIIQTALAGGACVTEKAPVHVAVAQPIESAPVLVAAAQPAESEPVHVAAVQPEAVETKEKPADKELKIKTYVLQQHAGYSLEQIINLLKVDANNLLYFVTTGKLDPIADFKGSNTEVVIALDKDFIMLSNWIIQNNIWEKLNTDSLLKVMNCPLGGAQNYRVLIELGLNIAEHFHRSVKEKIEQVVSVSGGSIFKRPLDAKAREFVPQSLSATSPVATRSL